MKTRHPRGVPVGGRFAPASHDDAAPMQGDISSRMDDIRGVEGERYQFAALALADAAVRLRQIAPQVDRVALRDYRHTFHAQGFYTASGERVRISDDDFREVQSRIDEVKPMLAISGGMVKRQPTGERIDNLYSLDIDSAIARADSPAFTRA